MSLEEINQILSSIYSIKLNKIDKLPLDKITYKQGNQQRLNQQKLEQFIMSYPIDEIGIDQTSIDLHMQMKTLKKPLLIEVKEFRNVGKPFQRNVVLEDDEPQKVSKKGCTYQLKVHDGKRLFKVVLLFNGQHEIVKNLHESNKLMINNAIMSTADGVVFLIDEPKQIQVIYNDKFSPLLTETYANIQGLPISYTSAPRFVFLNERADEEQEQERIEQKDEFEDLFKSMNVVDLTSTERTYIKRFEQLGFWRKKFNQ